MLLAIDIGNTNIVIGLYNQEKLKHDWRIQTVKKATTDEQAMIIKNLLYHFQIGFAEIKAMVISSVVPPLTDVFRQIAHKYFSFKPIVLEPGIKTGLNILYENPREVGADRIVNAVAAIYHYGSPVIIVDFGTATTFCLVDEQNNYCGGAIVPGVQISADSLSQHASKLPHVEITKPDHIIGRNAVSSLQAGLYYGYVSLVDGMIRRIQQQLNHPAKVIATGGLSSLICENTETIDVIDPYLTLEGLRLIYHRNK